MGNRVVVKEKKKFQPGRCRHATGQRQKMADNPKICNRFFLQGCRSGQPAESSQQRWSAPHFSEGRVPVSKEEKNVATNGERWVKSWGREDTKSRAVMTSERRPHMKPTATTDLLPRLQSGPWIIPSGFAPPSVDWSRLSCPKSLDS